MPSEPEYAFKQLTVIGTGAIGCSVAALLRGRAVAAEVVGCDFSQAHLEMADRLGFVDRIQADPARAVMGSTAVILAVPLDEVFKVMDLIGPDVRPGALITCTAGCTARLRLQMIRHIRSAENFVPSYPLVTVRGVGPGGASPAALEQAPCLVAAGADIPAKAVEQARSLWEGIGMQPHTLPIDAFESAVAGHHFWPLAVAQAAQEVASRGDWPAGASPLSRWFEQVVPPDHLDRSFQLYASRLNALLDEFIEALGKRRRALGGGETSAVGDGPGEGEA